MHSTVLMRSEHNEKTAMGTGQARHLNVMIIVLWEEEGDDYSDTTIFLIHLLSHPDVLSLIIK